MSCVDQVCCYQLTSFFRIKGLCFCKALQSHQHHAGFISLGELAQRYPMRTERIAACRNRYLDELQSNPRYVSADYVMVAALEGYAVLKAVGKGEGINELKKLLGRR